MKNDSFPHQKRTSAKNKLALELSGWDAYKIAADEQRWTSTPSYWKLTERRFSNFN
jgi:hypothetical protein